jgi:hypothetical protein
MQDRRKEQRWPALLGATIAFDRGFGTAECTVRNSSPTGALIKLHGTAFVPEQFELAIARRERAYLVRRRWRREGEIGVEIESVRPKAPAARVRRGRNLKRLQDENAALRRRLADLGE